MVGECSWHLGGRNQGCCSTFYNASRRTASTTKINQPKMSRVPKLRSPVLIGLLPIFPLSLSLMRSFIVPELRSHLGQHPSLVPVSYRINTPYPSCQEPSVTIFTVCYSLYTLSFGQKCYFSVASTESLFPPTVAPSISNEQLKAAIKFRKNYEKLRRQPKRKEHRQPQLAT